MLLYAKCASKCKIASNFAKKPFPSRGHLSGNQNQNQNPDLPDALHAGFGELGGIVP